MDKYRELKNTIYDLKREMKKKIKLKKWYKSSAFECLTRLEDRCNALDKTGVANKLPTRIHVYDYGFEIEIPIDSNEVTNRLGRFEDVLYFDYDQDIKSLFIYFTIKSEQYVYGEVPKEDYDKLKEKYLNYE
jgi:hypothetical protein